MGDGESADNVKKRRRVGEWVVTVRGMGSGVLSKLANANPKGNKIAPLNGLSGGRDARMEREATAEREEMRPFVLSRRIVQEGRQMCQE